MKSFPIAALVVGFLLVHLTDGLTFSSFYTRPPRKTYGLIHVWSMTLDSTMNSIRDDLHTFWDEHQDQDQDQVDGKALVDKMIAKLTEVMKLKHVISFTKLSLDKQLWDLKSKGIAHFLDGLKSVMKTLDRTAEPPPTHPTGIIPTVPYWLSYDYGSHFY